MLETKSPQFLKGRLVNGRGRLRAWLLVTVSGRCRYFADAFSFFLLDGFLGYVRCAGGGVVPSCRSPPTAFLPEHEDKVLPT